MSPVLFASPRPTSPAEKLKAALAQAGFKRHKVTPSGRLLKVPVAGNIKPLYALIDKHNLGGGNFEAAVRRVVRQHLPSTHAAKVKLVEVKATLLRRPLRLPKPMKLQVAPKPGAVRKVSSIVKPLGESTMQPQTELEVHVAIKRRRAI